MPRHPVGSLSPLIALIISISFWVGLGGSAALLGVIILSPRWLEVERTQADYVRNARVIRDLRKENDHLDRMAHALEFDADYRARVASKELRLRVPGEYRIALNDSLDFQTGLVIEDRPASSPAVSWHSPLLELMAMPGPVRQRMLIASVLLMLLTFFCFNERFLNGGLRSFHTLVFRQLGDRYSLSPASDEETIPS